MCCGGEYEEGALTFITCEWIISICPIQFKCVAIAHRDRTVSLKIAAWSTDANWSRSHLTRELWMQLVNCNKSFDYLIDFSVIPFYGWWCYHKQVNLTYLLLDISICTFGGCHERQWSSYYSLQHFRKPIFLWATQRSTNWKLFSVYAVVNSWMIKSIMEHCGGVTESSRWAIQHEQSGGLTYSSLRTNCHYLLFHSRFISSECSSCPQPTD